MISTTQVIKALGTVLNQALDIIQALLNADVGDKAAIAEGRARAAELERQLTEVSSQLSSSQIEDTDFTKMMEGFTSRLDALSAQAAASTAASASTSTSASASTEPTAEPAPAS